MQLEIQALPSSLMPTARFAAAAVVALGREEALGRRPKRLLEPGLATWQQFRGRMGSLELVELLCEDAAVTQPSGFTRPTEILPLSAVPAAQVDAWLAELPALSLDGDGEDYVTAQAKRLGLSTRMARSGLHKMQSHHKVLELPGSGGQLSYFVARRDGLFLQHVFTIACTDWTELALAGFVPDEVNITAEQNMLTVEGRKAEKGTHQYLYQGISSRPFRRQFNLAEYVQVRGASLEDGMLKIDLVREIPEALRPRQILINDNKKIEHKQTA